MKKLTQKRLKELLHYDLNTGIFNWKVNKGKKVKAGDIAGCLDNGYIKTRIDKKNYQNNRLAWLYIYGYFPEHNIDHINRIKIDNRISNLRETSQQCNLRNCGNYNTNTSGVKGVFWNKQTNRWHARITVNSKSKALGIYDNFDDAICARLAAEQCLDWNKCDSNSPAYQYVQKMLKRPKKIKLPKIVNLSAKDRGSYNTPIFYKKGIINAN